MELWKIAVLSKVRLNYQYQFNLCVFSTEIVWDVFILAEQKETATSLHQSLQLTLQNENAVHFTCCILLGEVRTTALQGVNAIIL